jgi:hypothetical protein
MRREKFSIANIYVPVKRRATLKPEIVQEIELRRQQLLQAAITKAQPTPEPDWSRLTDDEFLKARMRLYGF